MIAGGYGLFNNYPSGICLHHESNVFYIADMQNHRVCWLEEDGSTGALPSIVVDADGCSSLGRPLAVWVTNQGTIFVADAEHNKLFCKVQQEDVWRPIKINSKFSFNLPGGIAVDEIENVYTNDFLNNRLVQITSEGRITALLDGEKNINKPYGIFYQGNRLYYTDTGNARICYINLENKQKYIFKPKSETKGLSSPIALTLDEEGNIYICEQRSMYFIDVKKNTLSLFLDSYIWKEQMNKYLLKDRICHMGAVTVKCRGEIYWVDTIKGCVYQMLLKLS